MTLFLDEIWSNDRPLSQKSKNIWFYINWTSVAPDMQVAMAEGQ